MKKILFTLFLATALTACGAAYNTALKQIDLGMTKQEVVGLMGDKYDTVEQRSYGNETIMYKDRYKNYWYFVFVDNHLNKWYKETEN
ncbi:lipoprotein [Dysgonomonas sp. 520]|uniref:lipoprotein n=1 Tax=Dysgonomonas sp. 520 TaxID=2302931 RepID=UPI0013D39EA1|nr:lipoprotein [Dysgonomonas sp. 520]NDW08147.1 hypothetical protein [Dysgonomonas sp. 520]